MTCQAAAAGPVTGHVSDHVQVIHVVVTRQPQPGPGGWARARGQCRCASNLAQCRDPGPDSDAAGAAGPPGIGFELGFEVHSLVR